MNKEDVVFFILTISIMLFLCYRTKMDFKDLINSNVKVSTARSGSFWIKGFVFMGIPLFFINSNNVSALKVFFTIAMILAGAWNFFHGFLYLIHQRKNKNT